MTRQPGQLPPEKNGTMDAEARALRQAKLALEQREAEFSFLLHLNDALRQLDDPLHIQEVAARLLGERLQADRVFYGEVLVTDGIETLVIERDYHRPALSSLTGRFAFRDFSDTDYDDYHAGRTVCSSDVFTGNRGPGQQAAYRAAGVRAFIGVPFVERSNLVSVLGVLDGQARAWTPEEIGLAEQTADRTWHSIQRARVERALRQSEERFRLVLTHSPITVATVDRSLRYTWIYNPASGFTPEDVVGRTLGFVLSPPDRERLVTLVQSVLAEGTSAQAEITALIADDTRSFESHIEPLRDGQGEIVGAALVSIDISARKRADAALRASEREQRQQREFLECLVANAGACIAVVRGPELRYTLANPAFEVFSGGAPMVGRTNRDVFPEAAEAGAEARIRRVLETGEPWKVESYRAPVPGIPDATWEGHVVRLPQLADEAPSALAVVWNVTERQRAAEAAETATKLLDAHIHNSPLAVIEFDPECKVTRWSQEAERLFGWTAAEVTGRAIGELRWVYEDDDEVVREVWADMLEGRRPRNLNVNRNYRKDGSVVVCEWYNSAIYHADGRLTSVLSQVLDITERTRAEAALRDANATLEEADRRKDEFIAILSHELRNPLAPIRYAMPLLGEEPLGEAGRRAVAVVERQVAQLTRLVDDLLDVGRITTGKVQLRLEPVTLAAVLSAAVEAVSPAIAAAQHSLDVAAPDAPVWVNADATRLSQAVANLLNNSAKYTPRGGRIRLEAATADRHVVIRVVDNGAGMAAGTIPAMFEMFRQGTGGRKHGGLGIGLSLTRQLVEMHGGTIEAYSGGELPGTEVVIRLPLAAGPTVSQDGEGRRPSATPAQLRVLVVDDNVDLVDMLTMMVEGGGHQVRKAFDGRGAIEAALAHQPHLILLDVGMPDLSGMEVVKELRRHAELSGTRIVALTGWGQEQDRRLTAEAGFDEHLTKPADPLQIERILGEVGRQVTTRDGGQ